MWPFYWSCKNGGLHIWNPKTIVTKAFSTQKNSDWNEVMLGGERVLGEEGDTPPPLHPTTFSSMSRNRCSNGTRKIHNNYQILDPSVAKFFINIIELFPCLSHHNTLELQKLVVNSAVYYTTDHLLKQWKNTALRRVWWLFFAACFRRKHLHSISRKPFLVYRNLNFFAIEEFDTPIFLRLRNSKRYFVG